ncbi:MAG: hypothetical protein ABW039_12260 [Sphingobium sp.]
MVQGKAALMIAGLGAMLVATPAMAQYRDGQPPMSGPGNNMRAGEPETLAPPPPPADPALGAMSRFGYAYARAKSPRIVVFWNREFTDEVASKYEHYTRIDSAAVGVAASQSVAVGGFGIAAGASQGAAMSASSTEIRSGVDRVGTSQRASNYAETIDFDIEQAFQGTLSQSGARLVDRTSIMRTTGLAQGAGQEANVQGLETSAILNKADIVLEVVQMADSRKERGIAYRIIARNVRSGKVLARLSSDGEPPARPMPLVAGPNGFVRAVQPAATPSDVGRQLAVETMGALASAM